MQYLSTSEKDCHSIIFHYWEDVIQFSTHWGFIHFTAFIASIIEAHEIYLQSAVSFIRFIQCSKLCHKIYLMALMLGFKQTMQSLKEPKLICQKSVRQMFYYDWWLWLIMVKNLKSVSMQVMPWWPCRQWWSHTLNPEEKRLIYCASKTDLVICK